MLDIPLICSLGPFPTQFTTLFSAVNFLVSFLPAPSVAVLTGRVKLHLALALTGRVPYARDMPTKSRCVKSIN